MSALGCLSPSSGFHSSLQWESDGRNLLGHSTDLTTPWAPPGASVDDEGPARRTPVPLAAVRRHPVIAGALLGLGWGMAMRAWMRFIATDPEFSWSGTVFILAAATIAGAVLGLARDRRRAGGIGWWRLSILALFLLGAGGAVMWPTVILWAAAIGRRRPVWLVLVLGIAGGLAQIPVIDEVAADNWRFGTSEVVVATAWYLPMLAAEAWGFSVAFGPARATGPVARWKRAVVAAPVVAMALLSMLVIGLPD